MRADKSCPCRKRALGTDRTGHSEDGGDYLLEDPAGKCTMRPDGPGALAATDGKAR